MCRHSDDIVSSIHSHLHDIQLGENLAQRRSPAAIAAGTTLAGLLPRLPARRDSTARRATCGTGAAALIDAALAALAVEKDAIAVGKLHQALAHAHRADVAPLELLDRQRPGRRPSPRSRPCSPRHSPARRCSSRRSRCRRTSVLAIPGFAHVIDSVLGLCWRGANHADANAS